MKFNLETAPLYKRHYDEEGFWKKVRHVAAQVGAKVLYPALQLYYLLGAEHVPAKAKTLIVGALGYLILPTDLIPDFIPALGFTDDLTALMVVLRTLYKYLTPEISARAKEQADKLLRGASDD